MRYNHAEFFAGVAAARYKLPKPIIRVDAAIWAPAGKADYRWARDLAALDSGSKHKGSRE
jgi:fatty-acyl-CoA synthase